MIVENNPKIRPYVLSALNANLAMLRRKHPVGEPAPPDLQTAKNNLLREIARIEALPE